MHTNNEKLGKIETTGSKETHILRSSISAASFRIFHEMYHAAFRIDNDSKFTELVRIAFRNLNKSVNSTRKIPEKKRQTVFSLQDNPLALHIPSRNKWLEWSARSYFGMQISWPKKSMKYNFAVTIGRKKKLIFDEKKPPIYDN